jgi:E3 ubiquitin-protein ligase UHRF1
MSTVFLPSTHALAGLVAGTYTPPSFIPHSIAQTPASCEQGVRVGEYWKDRLDCRQWGAHFPHVAGIAGQSNVGAQSVVLSGG